jgi:hypothetical protein
MRGERLHIANKKAKKTFKIYHGFNIDNEDDFKRFYESGNNYFWKEKGYGQYRKTKVFCSNPLCCGNPRKRGELTVQERRYAT